MDNFFVIHMNCWILSDLGKSVGWFSNQVSNRYSANYGKKPGLQICDAQGVELCVEDQIGLFLSDQVAFCFIFTHVTLFTFKLMAKIIHWNIVPLHEKYEKTCLQYETGEFFSLKAYFWFIHSLVQLFTLTSSVNCARQVKMAS